MVIKHCLSTFKNFFVKLMCKVTGIIRHPFTDSDRVPYQVCCILLHVEMSNAKIFNNDCRVANTSGYFQLYFLCYKQQKMS